MKTFAFLVIMSVLMAVDAEQEKCGCREEVDNTPKPQINPKQNDCVLSLRADIIIGSSGRDWLGQPWNSAIEHPCVVFTEILRKYYHPEYRNMNGIYYQNPEWYKKIQKLNPHLNCSDPFRYARGPDFSREYMMKYGVYKDTLVCVSDLSKFNDKTVQQETTLKKFTEAYQPLQRRRSSGFNQKLYNAMIKVVNNQETSRYKRGVRSRKDIQDETDMINMMAEPGSIKAIRTATNADRNFENLEKEFTVRRESICAQLPETGRQTEYGKCVCQKDQPPPFIYCQAIFKKGEIKAQVQHFPTETVNKRVTRASNLDRFMDLMKIIGCSDIDNCGLDEICLEAEECTPIPQAPVLCFSVGAKFCMPYPSKANLKGILTAEQFKGIKAGGQIGICITGFSKKFSFAGLDGCIVGASFDFAFFSRQLEVKGYLALLVVRFNVYANVQIAASLSKGIGNNGIAISKDETVNDICAHKDHKCEDYCSMQPGSVRYGYNVEVWFFGWRTVKEHEKLHCK